MALVLSLAAAVVASAWLAGRATDLDPGRPNVVDFHPFYIAGRLALQGRLAESYDPLRMQAWLSALGGREASIPFVYPPAFGLVLAPLALLPLGAAFLVFTSATLGLYVAALRGLAGPRLWTALIVATPCIVVDARMGQNGLLTGALAGLSTAAMLRGRSRSAGVLAGWLVFKPQVAVALPLLFASRRDWRALAAAAVAAAAETAVAVLAFGADSLRAFLANARAVTDLMADGSLHLERLTSIYASAASLGLAPRPALVLHACALLVVVCAVAGTMRHRGDGSEASRRSAGLVLMSTGFVSPYFSGYDLPVCMAGLALVLQDLTCVLPVGTAAALLAGMGLAGFASIPLAALDGLWNAAPPSVGGPLLLLCFLLVARTLRGADRPAPPAAIPA